MIERLAVTEDHREYRAAVREFCEAEVAPHVDDHESTGTFPREVIRRVGEAGYIGVQYPEAIGGAGLDYRSYAISMEELSRAWKLVGGAVNIAVALSGYPVATWGTDWQREEWLTPVNEGDWLPAVAITEPEAGSDAAAVSTTARPAADGVEALEAGPVTADRDGDELVLDGHKVWSTNASAADFLLVLARTGGEGAGGLSLVGVPEPHDRDGVEVVRDIPCLEGEASIETELRFDGVRVPAANVVGEAGRGFRYMMEGLDIGRIGTAAQGVGVGQAALDASREYADDREQFGQPIREFQGVGFKLADMATDVEAARLLTLAAADQRDRGERVTKRAAMAKTFATDAAMDAASEAIQIHGARGYSTDYPVERYLRVAKGMQIYEGTNEINRLVIARRLYE
ncbi:MAG: acyl-CoA dehydrogenase family protein [Halobacteriales archaeon]|nr:acyl-CoA dehydrogenase family protein [Halobacteriales archaeon]